MARKKEIDISQIEGIEIANPLYDVVFKHLMENYRVATFFIESFIGEKIESITMVKSESTIFKWLKRYEKLYLTPKDKERLKNLTVIRMDFVATIQTEKGEYKKILIEIQKARDNSDVIRFRNYLADHYKRKDTVTIKDKATNVPIPIITIYLLGFNLTETNAVVIHVKRSYHDSIKDETLKIKIPFIEYLTHDSYLVQLGRITGEMGSRIEKVLSVFEQRYFIDSKTKTTKKYPHVTEDKNIRLMLDILEQILADPQLRSDIDLEWASYDILEGLVIDKNKELKKQGKKLQKALAESVKKDMAIAEKDQALAEKDQALAEKDDALAEKDQTIAEKDEALAEKDQTIAEKEEALQKAYAEIANLLQKDKQ